MRIIIILSVLMILVAAPHGWGEYYQYKDNQGNLRFTDNPANIPEDQRADTKTFDSVPSEPVQMPEETDPEPILNEPESEAASPDDAAFDDDADDAWEDRVVQSGKELEQMQEEIHETAESLQEQQEALKEQAPGENASPSEKALYFEKVSVLNAKINEYNKQREAFNQKVNDFNAQIGQK